MAYPAYVDNGGIAFNAGAAVDVPYPGTVNADDVLIIQVLDAAADDFTTPAGWTLLATSSKSSYQSTVWFSKVATGAEVGTETVTSDSADGSGIFGVMSRFSGCSEKIPIEGVDFEGPQRDTEYIVPSILTQGSERLLVAFPCVEDDVSIDPPVDWTEAFEAQSASGDGCSLAVEYMQSADSGVEAFTFGVLGGNDSRATMALALIPAAADNLINQATADVAFESDAEAKSAVRVGQATADIAFESDAIIEQKATIVQATADVAFETDVKVNDPWMENIDCISAMQIEVKLISNME